MQANHGHFISSFKTPKKGCPNSKTEPQMHRVSCPMHHVLRAECPLSSVPFSSPWEKDVFLVCSGLSHIPSFTVPTFQTFFLEELTHRGWPLHLPETVPVFLGIWAGQNGIQSYLQKMGGTKMTHSDEHDVCLLCLGEVHNVRSWSICQKFTPVALIATRLKATQWENASSLTSSTSILWGEWHGPHIVCACSHS